MDGKTKKQNDSRYKAVENRIRKAFFELLSEEGFQKTTIRLIVERTGINRSTFYLHYQDKYDLLREIEDELIAGHLNIAKQNNFKGLNDTDLLPYWKETAQYIWDHREWYMLLESPKGDPGFVMKIAETMRKLLYKDKVLTPGEEYRQAILMGVVLQVVRTWIGRGFTETPEDYVAYFISASKEFSKQISSYAGDIPMNFK